MGFLYGCNRLLCVLVLGFQPSLFFWIRLALLKMFFNRTIIVLKMLLDACMKISYRAADILLCTFITNNLIYMYNISAKTKLLVESAALFVAWGIRVVVRFVEVVPQRCRAV